MKLKEIRESRGISQRQAAIALNLSPTVYNRYENGLREPSNVIMLAMADYFGVSVDELLGRDPGTKKEAAPLGGLEEALMEKYRQLTPDQQKQADLYLEQYI